MGLKELIEYVEETFPKKLRASHEHHGKPCLSDSWAVGSPRFELWRSDIDTHLTISRRYICLKKGIQHSEREGTSYVTKYPATFTRHAAFCFEPR